MMKFRLNKDALRFKQEIWRKVIHVIFHTGVAVFVLIFDYTYFRYIFFLAAICVIVGDYYRIHGGEFINKIIISIFGKVIRDWEYRRLAASSYSFISLSIIMLIFPKEIVALSALYIGLADPAASIARIISKRLEFPGIKSLEGAISFVFTGIVITYLFSLFIPDFFGIKNVFLVALAGSVSGAIAETLSVKHFDDNLTVPLATATGLWLVINVL